MRYSLQIASWLIALAGNAEAGMYGQPVVNLDAKTFKQAMATEHAAMVAFVAPWCGHCKNLGPEYTAAASSLSPLIPFYAIDCDDAGNKPLCAEYQVKGFPTIKAFPRAGKGAARDYNGERKKGALVDYAKELVPDRVKKLRVDEGAEKAVSKFLSEKSNLPHALLIHPSQPSIPFLWKVLGHRLSTKMHMGYIRDGKTHDVLSHLGAYQEEDTASETIRAVVWPAGASDSTDLVVYDGQMKFNALLEWLQTQLSPSAAKSSSPPKQKPVKAPAAEPTVDTADDRAVRRAQQQAKMEEAERRDAARRARAAESQGVRLSHEDDDQEIPSSTDDAPSPEAAKGVDEDLPELSDEAAPPAPGGDADDDLPIIETGRTHIEL